MENSSMLSVIVPAVITAAIGLIGVVAGALITQHEIRKEAFRASKRQAYSDVVRRLMQWATNRTPETAFELLGAVCIAQLYCESGNDVDKALNELLHSVAESEKGKADYPEKLRNFKNKAQKDIRK